MYEVFEHTADLGLRARAPTLEKLLEEAARGFFSLLVLNLDDVRELCERRFHVPGTETEVDYLLFDWLNELLYAFESEKLVFARFAISVNHEGLRATAWGEPMDPGRHLMEHEVKAITYHGLTVEQTESGWLAEVIVDI